MWELEVGADISHNLVGSEEKSSEVGGDGSGKQPRIKTLTEYLWFNTRKRRAIIRITDKVRDAVKRAGVKEGFVLVSAMHITASVYVNDDEEGIMEDMMELLDSLAPPKPDYKHHRTGEDNGDAHLKSLLLHHEVIVPITDGDLDLGPWQEIFYAEFDGKRRKRVIIKVFGFA